MESFFSQYPGVAYTVVIGLLTLIGYMLKLAFNDYRESKKETNKKIEAVELRQDEMENNYKDEFKLVRKEQNDNHSETKDILTELKVQVASIVTKINNQI